jgi:hypothetical protein
VCKILCSAQFYNLRHFFSFYLGARVVIFLDQGRQNLAEHRREHPDIVFSDLPSRSSLEKAAAGSKYEITEFVDESTLYLAVLQFQG